MVKHTRKAANSKRLGKTRLGTYLTVCLLFLLAYSSHAQSSEHSTPSLLAIRRGPTENFTGTVWVQPLIPSNELTDCVVSNVTFEPKARTNWHTHVAGQILVVVQGTGYYQEKGKPIQLLRTGDAVNIAPNVVHWHGAAPNSVFTHTAINPSFSKGGTWLEAVTDNDYNSYPKE